MRVLLVTWDGAGNLPPERSLARAADHPGLERVIALVEAM